MQIRLAKTPPRVGTRIVNEHDSATSTPRAVIRADDARQTLNTNTSRRRHARARARAKKRRGKTKPKSLLLPPTARSRRRLVYMRSRRYTPRAIASRREKEAPRLAQQQTTTGSAGRRDFAHDRVSRETVRSSSCLGCPAVREPRTRRGRRPLPSAPTNLTPLAAAVLPEPLEQAACPLVALQRSVCVFRGPILCTKPSKEGNKHA